MTSEGPNTGPKRILLLINAKSRRGAVFAETLRKAAAEAGLTVANEEEIGCESFAAAIRAARGKVEAVFIAGGDGSMNAAIAGLLETGLPLGVLPLGTANNLARNLGLPTDPLAAMTELAIALKAGRTREVDLGTVNDLPFFNVAGLGLSNQVNREVPSELKRRFGVLAYIATALKVYPGYRPFRAKIRGENGETRNLRSLQISVCNGRYFGSGLSASDTASMVDRKLHLISVHVEGFVDMVRATIGAKTGRHAEDGPTDLFESSEFTIETNRPVKVDVDGEVRTKTPAKFRVLPKAIRVLAGP